jgi:glycosyltransferase involved in cell wall biosynthesis
MPEPNVIPTNLKDAASGPCPAEESAADKDARIARLTRDLAVARKDAKETAGRLLRQFEISIAQKEAQITECFYHLNRINASPWWRLGKRLEQLILSPCRFVAAAGLTFPIAKISSDRETVIVIAHEASRTGAPILAWNLIIELQSRYNVVALLKRGGAIERAFRDIAAAVVCLPDNFPLQGRELQDVVRRLIKAYSPVYAIANSVETRGFVPEIEKMGVPVVALVHEFSCYCWPQGTLNSLFETASQIVFSTRITAENAVKDYRSLEVRDFKILPQGPSKLPPNTNPSTTAAQAKTDIKELWPKDSDNLLLVVGMGAIQIRKGIDFFISTAALVRRAAPNREVRFAWVGKCYPEESFYLNFLKEQVERSGLTDTFAFIDEIDDLQPVYDQTDIFFLSSRLDPLPNVVIDSALNGIPVICFDQASGIAEILAETVDTRELVVPHLDAAAAARLICDLADNPTRLANLSKAILAVAETRFNMARYIEAIDELGRNAKTVRDQVKRDHALISKNNAFNADLYLGISANALKADEGLSKYLNASRLVVPRHRASAGLFLRRPLEGFHPLIYASDNPQFNEASGEDPLAHYIRTGRPSGRWAHQVLRPGAGRTSTETKLNVAVHGHFYYPELLPDFIKRLKCNTTAVDLYLTTTSAFKAEELSGLIAAMHFGRTKIIVVANRGRDLGAMLSELGERVLAGYDVVGHFHGKRSPQLDAQFGERWRGFLWEHLIGGEFPMMDVVLGAFAKDEDLGLVFAEDPHLLDWDDNRTLADELAQRVGFSRPLPIHFDFPMGTMFWARPPALKPFFDLGLAWDDYPEEPLPGDGTILHALERLLPFSADKAEFRYATTYVKSAMR